MSSIGLRAFVAHARQARRRSASINYFREFESDCMFWFNRLNFQVIWQYQIGASTMALILTWCTTSSGELIGLN